MRRSATVAITIMVGVGLFYLTYAAYQPLFDVYYDVNYNHNLGIQQSYSLDALWGNGTAFYSCGSLWNTTTNKTNSLLTKWDAAGNAQWVHTWVGADSGGATCVWSDDNSVFTLSLYQPNPQLENYDEYLIKWDSSGNVVWNQSVAANGLLGNGTSTYFCGCDPIGNFSLGKLNSTGQVAWVKSYPRIGEYAEEGESMWTDGTHLFILGYCESEKGLLLIETDCNGTFLWEKNYPLGAAPTPTSLYFSGGYLYACGGTVLQYPGHQVPFLVKWSLDGTLIWEKTENVTQYSTAYCIWGNESAIYTCEAEGITKWDNNGNIVWTASVSQGVPKGAWGNSSTNFVIASSYFLQLTFRTSQLHRILVPAICGTILLGAVSIAIVVTVKARKWPNVPLAGQAPPAAVPAPPVSYIKFWKIRVILFGATLGTLLLVPNYEQEVLPFSSGNITYLAGSFFFVPLSGFTGNGNPFIFYWWGLIWATPFVILPFVFGFIANLRVRKTVNREGGKIAPKWRHWNQVGAFLFIVGVLNTGLGFLEQAYYRWLSSLGIIQYSTLVTIVPWPVLCALPLICLLCYFSFPLPHFGAADFRGACESLDPNPPADVVWKRSAEKLWWKRLICYVALFFLLLSSATFTLVQFYPSMPILYWFPAFTIALWVFLPVGLGIASSILVKWSLRQTNHKIPRSAAHMAKLSAVVCLFWVLSNFYATTDAFSSIISMYQYAYDKTALINSTLVEWAILNLGNFALIPLLWFLARATFEYPGWKAYDFLYLSHRGYLLASAPVERAEMSPVEYSILGWIRDRFATAESEGNPPPSWEELSATHMEEFGFQVPPAFMRKLYETWKKMHGS
jgi:hypothetical protein